MGFIRDGILVLESDAMVVMTHISSSAGQMPWSRVDGTSGVRLWLRTTYMALDWYLGAMVFEMVIE